VLLNYHIGRIVLGSVYVGDSVWLGWSGIRVAGFSPQQSLSTMRRRKTIYRIAIILNKASLLSLLLEAYYVLHHFY